MKVFVVRHKRSVMCSYGCVRIIGIVHIWQHNCRCTSAKQSHRPGFAYSGNRGPAVVSVIGLLTGALVLSACGEANTPVSQRGSATVTHSTARVDATAQVVRARGYPSAARHPRRVVKCKQGQLTITTAKPQGGLGHFGLILRFKDRGGRCEMRGYPGVEGLAGNGKAVVEARRTIDGYLGGSRPGSPERRVLLQSGQTASALLEGHLGPISGGAPCRFYVSLRVTAPNDIRSVELLHQYSLCYLEIHPVVFGKTGGALSP